MSNKVAGIKNTQDESRSAEMNDGNDASGSKSKATASSLGLAGCYLGSACAYLSASFLSSEQFQLQVAALRQWNIIHCMFVFLSRRVQFV